MERVQTIPEFRNEILGFYKKNKRDLPWRKTRDPYKILVSEVMLQQTQVSRVLQKYPQFLRAFPNVQTLAKAPLKRILSVWQGMGYNRRAITLKRTAEIILELHGGRIPQNPEELKKLPGIGPYTASAIAVFAFNAPGVCIETNIRRTYIHHFFPKARKISDKKLLPIIEASMDKKTPREWYSALMDYGSALGKQVPNPNRKSKHYAPQKPFHGSNREVRGLILKTLIKEGPLRYDDLRKQIPHPKILENLKKLVREEFLTETEGRFCLI